MATTEDKDISPTDSNPVQTVFQCIFNSWLSLFVAREWLTPRDARAGTALVSWDKGERC